MIEAAALCIGVGFILSHSSRSNKLKAQDLTRATRVKGLKGLEEFLGKKPLSRRVVVYGTVGSTSTVENTSSGALGVFVEEAVTICFEKKKKNKVGSTQKYKKIVLNCKDVPWYLDDGTARVNVMEARYAKGFRDTLKTYFVTEPVAEHFEKFFPKNVQILQRDHCEHVLEIGTPLTVVGRAERDKDGVPTIGRAYEVFNGHINVDELVSNLESDSKFYGGFSLFLTAIGVVIVAVHVIYV